MLDFYITKKSNNYITLLYIFNKFNKFSNILNININTLNKNLTKI
jgi:hypothetical protein